MQHILKILMQGIIQIQSNSLKQTYKFERVVLSKSMLLGGWCLRMLASPYNKKLLILLILRCLHHYRNQQLKIYAKLNEFLKGDR